MSLKWLTGPMVSWTIEASGCSGRMVPATLARLLQLLFCPCEQLFI